MSLLSQLPPPSVIVRRVMLEDWSLKFISLLLAVLMWIYIDGELTDVREFALSLQSSNLKLPTGWNVAPGRPMPRYTVRLRGPRRRLSLANAELIKMQNPIPIDQPVSGRNALQIPLDNLAAPGFDVVGIFPLYDSEIAVELAQVVTQTNGKPSTLRLKLQVRPLPPAGAAMTVVPSEIEVDVTVVNSAEPGADLMRNIVLVAEWPAQWNTPESTQAAKLGPQTIQIRALSPSQFTVTGVDGEPLPTVTANGAWVPSLSKPAGEKPAQQ